MERKLALFALTDHDSIEGFEEVRTNCGSVPTLCALELSCREYDRSVHLLLYNVSESHRPELKQRLAEIRKVRIDRVYRVCEKLAALGAPIDPQQILDRARHSTPGRPHIAAQLVREGHCSTMSQAFARFLRDQGPADVPVQRLSLADGLALGRACQAKMSLAHPHVYAAPALVAEMLATHKTQGLEGLECYTASYSQNQSKRWVELASEHGCMPTAGSDFHGEAKPSVQQLGVPVPASVARELSDWLEVPIAVSV